MTKNKPVVTGGVDTHADTHTAAVIDEVGRLLDCRQFPADPAGYRRLLTWMRRHGQLVRVGVEGTGSYGAGLARHLHGAGVLVIEVDRPDRKARRTRGKSDPVDAEAAARAVLSGRATGLPKSRDGIVESIRTLRATRTGAVKARIAAHNALISLSRTAPEPLRSQFAPLKGQHLVAAAAVLRPGPDIADVLAATKTALRRLARRCQHLALRGSASSTKRRAGIATVLGLAPAIRKDQSMTVRSVPGPAGFGTDLRSVKAYVPLRKWQDVMDRAASAGMSVSAYLNALIDRDEVDEMGRPAWAAPTEDPEQEELPLTRAS